jgi:fibronectin type 3 domain-containing protein
MVFARRTGRLASQLACALALAIMAACEGGGAGGKCTLSAQPEGQPAVRERRAAVVAEAAKLSAPVDIAGAPVPAGVWTELKDALKSALATANSIDFDSGAPQGLTNKTNYFTVTANAEGSATFRWRYRNLGDYDQDSEVSLSDLSKLGEYYLAGMVDKPEEEPVDGDLNGEISISDVTPLAEHWLSTVTGYLLQAATMPDAPESEWSTEEKVLFSTSVKPADRGWRIFEYKLASPRDGIAYRVIPYYTDAKNKGVSSDAVVYDAQAAGRPQNLTASHGTLSGTVLLAWDSMHDALNYEVHRGTDRNGPYAQVGESEPFTTVYSDTAVTQGVHYWYKVRALLPAGLSEYSQPVEGWPLSAPEAPSGLAASYDLYLDRVALDWQESLQADDYQIFRRAAAGGNYSKLGETSQAVFNDLLAQPGQVYYYTVVACNDTGSSSPSAEACGLRSSGVAPRVLRVFPFEGTTGEHLEPLAYVRGGVPTSWNWNFGVGGMPDITIDQAPYILLGPPGVYLSTLTVANPLGQDIYHFVLDVRPANVAPVVEDVYPTTGTEQSVVAFTATTSGGLPTSWSWNFGGGAQPGVTISSAPVVTLGEPGLYNAAVTVANPTGEDVYFFTLEVGTAPAAPAPPQNLAASDGATTAKINLTWSPSAGASGYKVYRDNPAVVYADVPGTAAFADETVGDYLAHTYWVAAYNDIGTGAQSASDSGYRGLPAPGGLTATDGTIANAIRVSWSVVDGAEGYRVFRDGQAEPVASPGLATSWDDTAAGGYGQHAYAVRAFNSVQTGVASSSDTGYYGLGMAGGLTATDGDFPGFVRLAWNPVNGAESYYVYRDSSSAAPLIILGPVATYDDVVGDYNPHTYWVRAVNSLTQGSLSASDAGYRGLAAPNGLSASDGAYTGYVRLTWQAVGGATGYKVYRDAQASPLQTLGAVTTWDDPAGNYTLHTYWVRAVYNLGDSAFSAPDTGYCGLPAPSVVSATDGAFENKVVVNWSNVSGASRYNVYRGTTLVGNGVTSMSLDDTPPDYAGYTYTVRAVKDGAGESGVGGSDTGYRGLPAPASVSASDGTYTSKVALSWTAVSGASGYNIYRGATLLAANATGLSYDDTPSDYATYTYSVHAVHEGLRESTLYASDAGYRGLAAPASVSASDGAYTTKVAVSWNAVVGAASYNIYRDSTLVGSHSAGLAYDDTGVSDYLLHTYSVHCVNSSGSESPATGSDSGYRSLPAPPDMAASDGAYVDKVSLAWTAVSGAASYTIWRDSTQIATGVTALSYNDTVVADYATHTYKVYPVPASGPAGSFPGQDTGYRGLPAPANVSATDGVYGDRVQITWDSVPSATGYNVYRGTTLINSNIQYGSLPCVDSPSDFAQYTYYVSALYNSNESGTFGSDTGYRGLPGPSTLTASDGTYEDTVHVSWSAVTGAAGYNIYRGATLVGNGITYLTYDDHPADYGLYTYTVKAVNASGGESQYGVSDTGYRGLPAPTGVVASDGTFTTKVALTWNAVVGAGGYDVYRDSVLIGTNVATAAYDDTTVADYNQHNYRVHAVKAGVGESGLSGSDTGYRGLPAPATVTASDGTYSDRVAVSWSAVAGAVGYNVWRDAVQIATNLAAVSFNDTAVSDYALHTYKVYALNAAGQSGAAFGSDTGYRGLPAPGGVAATDGTYADHVNITWGSVAGATSYNVYRESTAHLVGSVATGNPLSLDDYDSPFSVYTYYVYAVGATGQSGVYGSDNGYAGTGLITDLEASDGTFATRIRLSWTKVPGANQYRIFRSQNPGADVQIFSTGDVDLYDDTDPTLISGATYYYRVRAYNTGTGELSGYSNEDTGYRAENNWQTPHVIDNTVLSSFLYTDMALVNNLPVVSYWDAGNPSLEVARATINLPGNSGHWVHYTLDSSGAAAIGKNGTSVAQVNGRPAIAYCNDTAGTLKYAYANNATPASASDWTIMTLEVGSVGNYPSLAVINGRPAIVFHAQGANQLKFILAKVAVPTSAADWNTSYTLDTEAGAGKYGTALIDMGGRAAVAYHASVAGKLKYARASVSAPTSAAQWSITTVETGGLGQWPALAQVGGHPAIAYVDNTNLELRYAYANDSEGASWTPTLVDGSNRTGAFGLSIVVQAGLPIIAYHESVSADLLIASASSATPAGPGSWDVVSPDENDCGDFPALAILSDGNPAVVYGGSTTALRFTRFVP